MAKTRKEEEGGGGEEKKRKEIREMKNLFVDF